MSLVGIYVLADDEKLYHDPVLYGNDWFLCFDDDDPPELVIEQQNRSKVQCRERALEVLAETGIEAKVSVESYDSSQRVFPPYDDDGDGNLRGATSFEVDVLKPIPAECLMHNEGSLTIQEFKAKPHQCIMYLFGYTHLLRDQIIERDMNLELTGCVLSVTALIRMNSDNDF